MRGAIVTLSAVAALAVLSPAAPAPTSKQLVVDKDKAQCSKADYTSIQAAVNAASPGDTIKVCPDLYTESVNVTKPLLTLVGPTNVNVGKCSTVTAADPTQDAIVTGAGSYSFSLLNNNVTLSGFVVQGSSNGIDTSAAFSGYRITNNLAQNNSASVINFLSNGTNQSRADHNCLRQNNASGLQSEIGNLSNALVDHNATYRNGFAGLDFSGAGARRTCRSRRTPRSRTTARASRWTTRSEAPSHRTPLREHRGSMLQVGPSSSVGLTTASTSAVIHSLAASATASASTRITSRRSLLRRTSA